MTLRSRFASLAVGAAMGVALGATAAAPPSADRVDRADAVWGAVSVNDAATDGAQTPVPADPADPDDAVWG